MTIVSEQYRIGPNKDPYGWAHRCRQHAYMPITRHILGLKPFPIYEKKFKIGQLRIRAFRQIVAIGFGERPYERERTHR